MKTRSAIAWVLLVVAVPASAGIVTMTNSTESWLRITFDDGAYVGSVICAPKSHVEASVAIAAGTWTAAVESSADGLAYGLVTGGAVNGSGDFLGHAQLSVDWDGVLRVRSWRQDAQPFINAFLVGFACGVPMFGIVLLISAVRKGINLGKEGAA